MSDFVPVQRSKRRIASPQPLQLTPGEAEILRAAVQRIIRASKPASPEGQPPETKKSTRR